MAAALKQSFEQGDMSGAMLAHKQLTELLKLKAELEEGGSTNRSAEPATGQDKRPIIETGNEAEQAAPAVDVAGSIESPAVAQPADPRVAEADAAQPQVVAAQGAEPQVAASHAAEPSVAETEAAELQGGGAQPAEPRDGEAQPAPPQYLEAQAAAPEVVEAESAAPQVIEVQTAEPPVTQAQAADREVAEAQPREPQVPAIEPAEPQAVKAQASEPHDVLAAASDVQTVGTSGGALAASPTSTPQASESSPAAAQEAARAPDRADRYTTFYDILGVEPLSPFDNIRIRYLKLVTTLIRQRDAGNDMPVREFRDRLRTLSVAYDVLRDPNTRTDYDFRLMGLRGNSSRTSMEMPEDAQGAPTSGRPHLRIGELLQCSEILEASELEIAVDMHKAMPEMAFGQFLVTQGFLTDEELHAALVGQHLISDGKISVAQFQIGMFGVRETSTPIGETLVARGWVEARDIEAISIMEPAERGVPFGGTKSPSPIHEVPVQAHDANGRAGQRISRNNAVPSWAEQIDWDSDERQAGTAAESAVVPAPEKPADTAEQAAGIAVPAAPADESPHQAAVSEEPADKPGKAEGGDQTAAHELEKSRPTEKSLERPILLDLLVDDRSDAPALEARQAKPADEEAQHAGSAPEEVSRSETPEMVPKPDELARDPVVIALQEQLAAIKSRGTSMQEDEDESDWGQSDSPPIVEPLDAEPEASLAARLDEQPLPDDEPVTGPLDEEP